MLSKEQNTIMNDVPLFPATIAQVVQNAALWPLQLYKFNKIAGAVKKERGKVLALDAAILYLAVRNFGEYTLTSLPVEVVARDYAIAGTAYALTMYFLFRDFLKL